MLIIAGCSYQKPMVIVEPATSRVVIKEVPTSKEAESEKKEYFEGGHLYPDLTRGYVENDAFPYRPKVWLLAQGKKVLLIGPEKGPPNLSMGEIREFNLPPGKHILHIERWQYFAHYEGWEPIRKIEIVKLSIAQFRPGRWHYWRDSHYGWWLVVHPDSTTVYSGYVD